MANKAHKHRSNRNRCKRKRTPEKDEHGMTQPRRKKVPGYVARELELATPQIGVIIADAEAARA